MPPPARSLTEVTIFYFLDYLPQNNNKSVAQSVAQSDARSVARSVSRSVARSVTRSVTCSVGLSFGRSVGHLSVKLFVLSFFSLQSSWHYVYVVATCNSLGFNLPIGRTDLSE